MRQEDANAFSGVYILFIRSWTMILQTVLLEQGNKLHSSSSELVLC